ncbi:hypothetical protein FKP32DRAFT_1020783 [Trametes sanguinea]|nr:hypothetical protein FKP32DRAFT_1020783 [Trametes sanguinea]
MTVLQALTAFFFFPWKHSHIRRPCPSAVPPRGHGRSSLRNTSHDGQAHSFIVSDNCVPRLSSIRRRRLDARNIASPMSLSAIHARPGACRVHSPVSTDRLMASVAYGLCRDPPSSGTYPW